MKARAPAAGLLAHLTIYLGVPFLGVLCVVWSLVALPARAVLPRRAGLALGRQGVSAGFRIYLGLLRLVGAYRFDLQALEELAHEGGVVVAPNHPSLIDAAVLLAHHPNAVCIMKTSLMRNVFLGAGARLAGFIGNTPPRRMISDAVEALQGGAMLLLFPEGTRTRQHPVNDFQLTVGAVAKHAHAPVVTVFIETDSAYLSKGWPLFRVPALPITYRVRLGRRFTAPSDVREFTAELQGYFRGELRNSPLGEWLPQAAALAAETPRQEGAGTGEAAGSRNAPARPVSPQAGAPGSPGAGQPQH